MRKAAANAAPAVETAVIPDLVIPAPEAKPVPENARAELALLDRGARLAVNTIEDAEMVSAHLAAVVTFRKWWCGLWDTNIAAANALHKGLCASRKLLDAPAEALERKDRLMLQQFADAQRIEKERRERAAEMQRQADERERQRKIAEAEEAQRKERERLQREADAAAEKQREAALAFAREMDDLDAVAEIEQAPVVPVALPPMPEIYIPPVAMPAYVPPVAMPSGVRANETWVGDVTDYKAFIRGIADGTVPGNLIEIKEAEINRLAASAKGTMEYPGLTFTRTSKISRR